MKKQTFRRHWFLLKLHMWVTDCEVSCCISNRICLVPLQRRFPSQINKCHFTFHCLEIIGVSDTSLGMQTKGWPHTQMPHRIRSRKSCHPSVCYQRRHRCIHHTGHRGSISASLECTWGSDHEWDSTFALRTIKSPFKRPAGEHAPGSDAGGRAARGTLTRRSCLIWLFHLLMPCQLVRLLGCCDIQTGTHTCTHASVHSLELSNSPAQGLPVTAEFFFFFLEGESSH